MGRMNANEQTAEWETFNNFLKWKRSAIAKIGVSEKLNIDHLTHLSDLLPQSLTEERFAEYWDVVGITYAKWLTANRINKVKYRRVYSGYSKNNNGETIQNLWFHNGLKTNCVPSLLWESFTVDNLTTCYFQKEGK